MPTCWKHQKFQDLREASNAKQPDEAVWPSWYYAAAAAAIGAMVLVYNPVAPMFSFSGWQRAILAASTLPFLASLAWPNAKLVTNE